MCGIFGLIREPVERKAPSADDVAALLSEALASTRSDDVVSGFAAAASTLTRLDTLLKGTPGVRSLITVPGLADNVESQVAAVDAAVAAVESDLDAGRIADEVSLEDLNKSLVLLKDATWAIRRDRLRTASEVAHLAAVPLGTEISASLIDGYTSVQLALSSIDRLEVRGRDSAGIGVLVSGYDSSNPEIQTALAKREDPLFHSGAVHRSGNGVVFVYKEAAEIGALGDNVKGLRDAIVADATLRTLVSDPNAVVSIVSHTRWASVGTVSESNCHPVDSQESQAAASEYVVAALNGDVDNYAELKLEHGLHVADDITTDAKVIPVLVGRGLGKGEDLLEAFRSTVASFDGSVAIEAASPADPTRLVLAVRGSGQGCYIGLAEGAFIVASEPYGLVEECSSYIRMDGEVISQESGRNGQVIELRTEGAGTLAGMRRISYGGEALPIDESELITPEVTTRDIDRGGAPHFLLKEITESPQSVRRTLRGKVIEENGRLSVSLSPDSLPESIKKALSAGTFKNVVAIGQGTAAIASRSLVAVLERIAPAGISVVARPATELSGFGLRDDMSDTLIVAVSQSGTTTDTNRTVDLVRSRGAKVIAIVNRRQSDLTDKADGVLYTSDGRDVEMSVASTKAFYAQVTAASLLAIAIADAVGTYDRQEVEALLQAFRALPEAMKTVLERRPVIAAAAKKFAPSLRSWAIVGNGPNHIAANEVRIKLSELCYKSIACDVTEDKKHIDLSAEPMILVCAAGLSGSNAIDVAKEVAIYRAHKATAIVIASDGAAFDAAAAVISVPVLHPIVDFLLSAMAGHLFGYEAALAIDSQGRLMRNARAVLEDAMTTHADNDDELLYALRSALTAPAQAIFAELSSRQLNGHLEPSTAVRLASLLRYATGVLPLDSLEIELGKPTSPMDMATELLSALSSAVDELGRPIDAVKHQAKTVTVGISRTEDSYADNRLVNEVVNAGAPRDRISYRSLRTLAALDEAVENVIGYTRYSVSGDVSAAEATIQVMVKAGVAQNLASRVEVDPRLTGTKHRAAFERLVTVGRGQRDGRSVIIVPELSDQLVTNITLLHVEFKDTLAAEASREMLIGYRNRYGALVDAVTETEPKFDDSRLAGVPVLDLLVEPVRVLAQSWQSAAS